MEIKIINIYLFIVTNNLNLPKKYKSTNVFWNPVVTFGSINYIFSLIATYILSYLIYF